jgi:isoprenylcysteine carboxyl methyltransferase (ICMT) family protein YpbQ
VIGLGFGLIGATISFTMLVLRLTYLLLKWSIVGSIWAARLMILPLTAMTHSSRRRR